MKSLSSLIKIAIFLWLIFCAWASWISLNALAYLLLVSNNMSGFAWIAGLMSTTSGLIVGIAAFKSLKFDAIIFMKNKLHG